MWLTFSSTKGHEVTTRNLTDNFQLISAIECVPKSITGMKSLLWLGKTSFQRMAVTLLFSIVGTGKGDSKTSGHGAFHFYPVPWYGILVKASPDSSD